MMNAMGLEVIRIFLKLSSNLPRNSNNPNRKTTRATNSMAYSADQKANEHQIDFL
jgi:hypothetical protein